MPMIYSSVDEIIIRIEKLYQRFQFLITYEIEEKSTSIVKAKIFFNQDLYIQVYVNIRRPKISFALILNNHRLYGKDFLMGKWHRHPFESPQVHDTSTEGIKETAIEPFFLEVIQYLEANDLI